MPGAKPAWCQAIPQPQTWYVIWISSTSGEMLAQAFMGSKLMSCSVLYALSIRSRRAKLEPSAALSTQCDSTKVKPCSLLSSRSDTSASPLCAALLCLKLWLAAAPPQSSPSASAPLPCCLGLAGAALLCPRLRLAAAPEEDALQCSVLLLLCCLGLTAGRLLTCVILLPCIASCSLPRKPRELGSCCWPAASAACATEPCAVPPSLSRGPCTALSSCSISMPVPAACTCTARASLLQPARSISMLRMERLLACCLFRLTAAGVLCPRLLGRFPLDVLS